MWKIFVVMFDILIIIHDIEDISRWENEMGNFLTNNICYNFSLSLCMYGGNYADIVPAFYFIPL